MSPAVQALGVTLSIGAVDVMITFAGRRLGWLKPWRRPAWVTAIGVTISVVGLLWTFASSTLSWRDGVGGGLFLVVGLDSLLDLLWTRYQEPAK